MTEEYGQPDVRLAQARKAYAHAVFGADESGLADAERGLLALEAESALVRGQLLHAQFLQTRREDPDELEIFTGVAETFRLLGRPGLQAEAVLWTGLAHQVLRGDDATAVPLLRQALELAEQSGEELTASYALRHLGIAAHRAGRLDEAADLLGRSTDLRRAQGFVAGVAANLVGLAYVALGQDQPDVARERLAEARTLAAEAGALAITAQVDEASGAL